MQDIMPSVTQVDGCHPVTHRTEQLLMSTVRIPHFPLLGTCPLLRLLHLLLSLLSSLLSIPPHSERKGGDFTVSVPSLHRVDNALIMRCLTALHVNSAERIFPFFSLE
jgi:hypothetical protein